MDTQKRTIAKTITFRIVASLATIALVLIFTKDYVLAGVIGILDVISKLAIYYFHERIWDKIHWGKKRFRNLIS